MPTFSATSDFHSMDYASVADISSANAAATVDDAVFLYTAQDEVGIMAVSLIGCLSTLAVSVYLPLSWRARLTPAAKHFTHAQALLLSLLSANVFQAVGAIMNLRWVQDNSVVPGSYCSAQGAIKNLGNVGTAFWSFVFAVYAYRLLFLRKGTSAQELFILLPAGWVLVALVPILGVTAIQKRSRGAYFGPSGLWCWITDEYGAARTWMEYFFEFSSAVLSILLYVLIFLRVRGNLVRLDDIQGTASSPSMSNEEKPLSESTASRKWWQGWRLRFVPRGERWQLALVRDAVDERLAGLAARVIWYPIIYLIIILPIALCRLTEFAGGQVPVWATLTTDAIFNSTGLLNVCLTLIARHYVPGGWYQLPENAFTTARKPISSMHLNTGITPFDITTTSITQESAQQAVVEEDHPGRRGSFDLQPILVT